MAKPRKERSVVPPLAISERDSSARVIRSLSDPRRRVRVVFPDGGGRTKQSFKAECDINNIMARFVRTGVLDFTNRRQAQYGDVTGLEYQSAMDLVVRAREMFAELPSAVRSRFQNEPGQFLDFVQDPANAEEMVKMGLATARPMVATGGSDAPPKGAAVDADGVVEPARVGGRGGDTTPPSQPPLEAGK